MTLHEVLHTGGYEVKALLTTLTEEYDRTCMHGVRRILLEQQADALGLPLEKIFLSTGAPNEEYESRMREVLEAYKQRGVDFVLFGDIFLEDLRAYRESKLQGVGMQGVFPLWNRDTGDLARTFIRLGFEADVTCVDTNYLDESFVGKKFDENFLAMLPERVDPCGENGEFHSYVYNGPIFRKRIEARRGEVVLRENRFAFCDLLPASGSLRP